MSEDVIHRVEKVLPHGLLVVMESGDDEAVSEGTAIKVKAGPTLNHTALHPTLIPAGAISTTQA